jgi:hypothetical protein
MSATKGAYNSKFPAGTLVRMASQPRLDEFMGTWRFHHPLTEDQLGYAGVQGKVVDVGFYHGGDELYHVEGVPGLWHEACLDPAPFA